MGAEKKPARAHLPPHTNPIERAKDEKYGAGKRRSSKLGYDTDNALCIFICYYLYYIIIFGYESESSRFL